MISGSEINETNDSWKLLRLRYKDGFNYLKSKKIGWIEVIHINKLVVFLLSYLTLLKAIKFRFSIKLNHLCYSFNLFVALIRYFLFFTSF